jgi:hypothetical protein
MALALLHTYSLKDLAEGWTDDCKIVYKAITYAELKELQAIKPKEGDEAAAVDAIVKFVQDHFVSGKGMTLNANGDQEISDLTKDDVAELPVTTISKLFAEMTGQDSDPKGEPTTPAS